MKHFLNILMGVVMMAVFSCDSSSEDPISDEQFFPLKTGMYQEYAVEEIRYELRDPDTVYYDLRNVVVDSFPNSNGRFTFIIHRSKRAEGENSWKYLDTWSAEADSREVVVSESNIPYVKLGLPLKTGRMWDGNAYNNIINPSSNEHEDLYEVIERGKSLVLGDLSFGEYVKIEQEDNQEFIVYFDQRTEIYARNVGLVSREVTQLQYCTNTDCLGDQIVDSGLIIRQVITAYGEE